MPLTPWFIVKAAVCAAGVAAGVVARISRANHPFQTFGPANYVTAFRAAIVALVAGAIGEPNDSTIATGVTVAAIAATLLDGVDGWLARRSGVTSAFGA